MMKTTKQLLCILWLVITTALALSSCHNNETEPSINPDSVFEALDWGENCTTYVIGHKSDNRPALQLKQRSMVFTMILNKKANYTDILFYSEGAKEAAEKAFGKSEDGYIRCQGQMSRKNDFVPAISEVLQQ